MGRRRQPVESASRHLALTLSRRAPPTTHSPPPNQVDVVYWPEVGAREMSADDLLASRLSGGQQPEEANARVSGQTQTNPSGAQNRPKHQHRLLTSTKPSDSRRTTGDPASARLLAKQQQQRARRRPIAGTCSALLLLVAAASWLLGAAMAAAGNGSGRQVEPAQLLQSANVELARRSDRLQRDTNAPADQRPTCGYPGSPAHASVTFNTSLVTAGTAASYTCDNGYELLGPPRRICQANGTWSPVGIPFCVLNVGLGKAAMQSSTVGQGSAQKAVDGSTTPYFQASICTMTDAEHSPWWYVNLLEPYLVQIVRIDFGTACCANRQKATIAVRVGNNRPDLGNNPLCNRYHGFIEEGKPLFLPCTRPAPGAFVSIHLEAPNGQSLSICETFIYTDHALSIEQCPSFRDQPLGSTATYNGKCYLFHNNQALNFEGARKYCESRGGTLVDETSPALQGFLSWELYRRHRNDQLMGQYWLGAVRDTRNPQNWKWINGKDVQISFWNSLNTMGNCSRFDGSKGWLWSDTDCNLNLNFICQYRPLSCGKPEKPTNSTLVTKNIDNGTVIEYQCAPGNLLMGPKSRACLPTGFFSEFAPKCKYLDCQFPAMIANGDYRLLNGTTSYQSIVTYFCNEGYQLYGKATLACDVDERWNGPPPRCEPLLCPAPVPPSNGYVTVTSNITVPGTQATYDCRPGYELVGDRLLACLQSGSWDNSFPYCREKRNSVPSIVGANGAGQRPALGAALSPSGSSRQSPQSGGVQFPASAGGRAPSSGSTTTSATATIGGGIGASSAIATTTSTMAPTTTSLPASLNGLAGQFVTQNLAPTLEPSQSALPPFASQTPSADQPNSRRPSMAGSGQLDQSSPSSTQQPTAMRSRPPQSGATSTQQPTPISTLAASNRQQTTSSATSNNRFPFASSTSTGYSDSTPLATSNSVSVHHQQQTPTSSSTSTPTMTNQQTTTSAGSTQSPPPLVVAQTLPPQHNSHQHQGQLGGHSSHNSVLSSSQFSPTIRASSHNSLASTRYSLDGIIAVAIFGGFLFLGAIITVLVIIVRRRKSGRSSTIDAQTISTYDSNAEHNGLYRNYQQAWENLRFANPNSHPKSSGQATGLISAHVSGGPSVGLKNLAAPSVALVHHPMHHHLHGHQNLAMEPASSSGSSSSQSSSLGGVNGPGGDPLLRRHHLAGQHAHGHHHHGHHHHHHHHLSQQQQRRALADESEAESDEEETGADQGILSSDEVATAHHSHRHRLYAPQDPAGEGFRDTNELTINADTVAAASQHQLPVAGRHRLYSANSMSRRDPMAANRLSAGNIAGVTAKSHHHAHQAHHAHHHHQAAGSASSSGHQRLVSSSTPSASTRSSQASPAADEHSLEQLAYGNNWRPAVASAGHTNQASDSSSSGRNNSAGSGASILGRGNPSSRYN